MLTSRRKLCLQDGKTRQDKARRGKARQEDQNSAAESELELEVLAGKVRGEEQSQFDPSKKEARGKGKEVVRAFPDILSSVRTPFDTHFGTLSSIIIIITISSHHYSSDIFTCSHSA